MGTERGDIADPERVVRKMVEQYNLKRDEIFHGVRGRENEARKVAMYLMKRCCDRTLPKIRNIWEPTVMQSLVGATES
jgi:chromosomal replication initiation ATPase DnaA